MGISVEKWCLNGTYGWFMADLWLIYGWFVIVNGKNYGKSGDFAKNNGG